MKSIVEHGLKIDLHIHSCASAFKDGGKVKNNTLENISLLIKKLDENGVNICSITDHDTFSEKMYYTLKKAETDKSSILKVLPGVEFSVSFINLEGQKKTIHIVTIFSDNDDEKISKIESILENNRPDENEAYSEELFLKVLKKIDLDTILIAHQKESLSSRKPRKNDVNCLGKERFFELVASDYFEAYEFKNKNNEVLNKSYLTSMGMDDRVRFVTGTDCHDWQVYPREDPTNLDTDFPFTYAKCLPTFRGLVMALTDTHRLKRVDSFFNVDKTTLDYLEIENNGKVERIPLSKGINVIIGDNSIGKSLLLHALSGYEKEGEGLNKQIIDGYKAYLKKKSLKIKKQFTKDNVFVFDMQGEVRKKFEQNRLVASEFANYFPPAIDSQPYKTIIQNEIERLISYLENKFRIDSDIRKLNSFRINIDDSSPESLSFVEKLRNIKADHSKIDTIISAIDQIKVDYSKLLKQDLDESDYSIIKQHIESLIKMRSKYEERKNVIVEENERIEIVASVLDNVIKKHGKSISDRQKKNSIFLDNTVELKESLKAIIAKSRKKEHYSPSIDKIQTAFSSNPVQDYCFVSRLNATEISSSFFMQHVNSLFKSKKKIDLDTITENRLKESLLRYDGTPALQFFKAELTKSFEDDFAPKQTINLKKSEKTEELSAGLNSKIYFDLLSYESRLDGIYIIDQPEDNVSPLAIKDYLIDCFRTMGQNRQVIMVSHNPQFIVNLDIDNLIYIFCDTDGNLCFQSGALEYECEEYHVLKLVEDNIDGGLDSIQKRWKRYEKNNRV